MNRRLSIIGRIDKKILGFFLAVFLTYAGILAANGQTNPQIFPVEIAAAVDRDTISIGDKLTYTLTVKADKSLEIEFPRFAENPGGFAIKDFGSSKKKRWGKKIYRQWYKLDTYASGTHTIPAATVKYRRKNEEQWQKARSNEVTVEVKSVLEAAADKSDIRSIAGPIGFPVKLGIYVLIGSIILIILGGIVLFLLRKKKKQEKIVPSLPAHEIAYQAFKELKKKEYIRYGKVKEYYVELSGIVRRYSENRFNLRAPEMTTEEFLNTLRDNEALSDEHKNLLRDFLSHCDLVKFAKYEPLQEEADLSFESAKKLVDQTKEKTKNQQNTK